MEIEPQITLNKKIIRAIVAVLVVLLFATTYLYRQEISQRFGFGAELTTTINELVRDVSTPGALVSKIDSGKTNLTEAGIFSYTNLERTKGNLPFFRPDQNLSTIARLRLEDMFKNGYFEHISPTGHSAGVVAENIKYDFISIGENIAMGNFGTDEALVRAWMESPGHRANIVSEKFVNLGVAAGKGLFNGKETWIAVQIFSRPLSDCPTVSLALKESIETLQREVEIMESQLIDTEKRLKEAEKRRRQNQNEYGTLVGEYNNLVGIINKKINELKTNVDVYNSQVRAFNVCVE